MYALELFEIDKSDPESYYIVLMCHEKKDLKG